MTEQWEPISGYEGRYEVSNLGRVKSLTFKGKPRSEPFVLTPTVNVHGYVVAALFKEGKHHPHRVSRVVLIAFVGPAPSEQHQCAHYDGNKRNNRLDNLRWATPKENSADQRRHTTSLTGIRNKFAKLTEADVHAIRQRAAANPRRGILKEMAKDYCVDSNTIGNVVNRNTWKHI